MGQTSLTNNKLWTDAYTRLVPWTMKRHRVNADDAQEMVQEAMRLFIKAGEPPDGNDYAGLLRALGSRINGVAVNRRRKKALIAVQVTRDGQPAELDSPTDVEQRYAEADAAKKAIGVLLERLGDDDLALSVVMKIVEGVATPAAQAQQLGVDVREVYNARRRLNLHVKAVAKTMEAW